MEAYIQIHTNKIHMIIIIQFGAKIIHKMRYKNTWWNVFKHAPFQIYSHCVFVEAWYKTTCKVA